MLVCTVWYDLQKQVVEETMAFGEQNKQYLHVVLLG